MISEAERWESGNPPEIRDILRVYLLYSYRSVFYIFLTGAISTFIFLIPVPENAISATDHAIDTIVPIPYWACSTRSPREKSEAEFFAFGVLATDEGRVDPAPEKSVFKLEKPLLPLPNILCALPRFSSICIYSVGISFINLLFGLAL